MKKILSPKALLAVGVLMVALVGFAAVAISIYTAALETRNLGAAVFAFAARHGRMPQSMGELVRAGYARPIDGPDTYVMLPDPQRQPLAPAVTINRFEVPWAVEADQLVEHDKGIFRRDDPDERVLLVRHTNPPLAVRAFSGRLAMAFPVELYRELKGQPGAHTQPASIAVGEAR